MNTDTKQLDVYTPEELIKSIKDNKEKLENLKSQKKEYQRMWNIAGPITNEEFIVRYDVRDIAWSGEQQLNNEIRNLTIINQFYEYLLKKHNKEKE